MLGSFDPSLEVNVVFSESNGTTCCLMVIVGFAFSKAATPLSKVPGSCAFTNVTVPAPDPEPPAALDAPAGPAAVETAPPPGKAELPAAAGPPAVMLAAPEVELHPAIVRPKATTAKHVRPPKVDLPRTFLLAATSTTAEPNDISKCDAPIRSPLFRSARGGTRAI